MTKTAITRLNDVEQSFFHLYRILLLRSFAQKFNCPIIDNKMQDKSG